VEILCAISARIVVDIQGACNRSRTNGLKMIAEKRDSPASAASIQSSRRTSGLQVYEKGDRPDGQGGLRRPTSPIQGRTPSRGATYPKRGLRSITFSSAHSSLA
jgi:hypothetical protein